MSLDAPTKLNAETPKQRRAMRQVERAFHLDTSTDGETDAPELDAPAPAMQAIDLKRNYHPRGKYEIVGYWKDEIVKKSPAGVMEVVQPREFIPGEGKPAKVAGVGYKDKLWAGTIVKLPKDEARAVKQSGVGEYEIADD